MEYRKLGNTGLFVSRLCLGTMSFGLSAGRYAAGTGVTQKEADGIIRQAFDAGINLIDTANVYTEGQSEEIVGRALKNSNISRQEVVLATKLEHPVGKGPNDSGASRYHIMHQVEQSLRRLDTDHIDLYQLHGWDPVTPVEETLRALDDLIHQGKVRYIGVSNWAAWQVASALGSSARLQTAHFQSLQAYYSLVGRELEREIVPMLEHEKLGLMVYSPLAGGYLTGKYRDGRTAGRRQTIPFPPVDELKYGPLLTVMDDIAAAHDEPLSAIALAWLLKQPVVTSVIIGVKHSDQLTQNLRATIVNLSERQIERLNEASTLAVEYPGWMFALSGGRKELLRTGHLPNATI